jgi:hypothetical protein
MIAAHAPTTATLHHPARSRPSAAPDRTAPSPPGSPRTGTQFHGPTRSRTGTQLPKRPAQLFPDGVAVPKARLFPRPERGSKRPAQPFPDGVTVPKARLFPGPERSCQ